LESEGSNISRDEIKWSQTKQIPRKHSGGLEIESEKTLRKVLRGIRDGEQLIKDFSRDARKDVVGAACVNKVSCNKAQKKM